MENRSVMLLVIAFMTLIVGVGLLSVVAEEGNLKTNKIYVSNESIDISSVRDEAGSAVTINQTVQLTITNAPTGWKISQCPITGFRMRNQTGQTMISGTDYYFTSSSGLLNLSDTVKFNSTSVNNTGADYSYCGDDYLTQAWQRTVLDLIPGFFALALLGISLGLFYTVMKEEGLLSI